LLTPSRRPRDHGELGYVGCHRDADAAQGLNAFGDLVHEVRLFLVVLIVQQVKLVERDARHLPV
jgi:hypothetical protein